MSIQDRTLEFQKCVKVHETLNKKYQTEKKTHAKEQKTSAFSNDAILIAKEITKITKLLSELAILVQNDNFFDNNLTEINNLTQSIKKQIFIIEQNIQNLKKKASSETKYNNDKENSKFTKNVIIMLSSKFKNVSGDFKTILENRQKIEMNIKNRSETFFNDHPNQNSTKNFDQSSHLNNLNENPYLNFIHKDNHVAQSQKFDLEKRIESSTNEHLMIPNQTQQLIFLEEQNNEYLQQRNRAVETIESTINEVGNLFQQLATLVAEQGEQIRRIDENLDEIGLNIFSGHDELLKYYNRISNNKWLLLKIFGSLIFFFFIWVFIS